ncbi:MlaD family protein [Thermosulfuriphilus sp.]
MTARRSNSGAEIKVGIFVLVALLLLGYLSLKLGEETVSPKKAYEIKALFDDVSGLVKGARVEMAGVEIGRVRDIHLKDSKAEVVMNIYSGVKIREDATAMVRTKGALGDKYIQIRQGSPQSPILPPGGLIAKTMSTKDLDQILTQVGPAIEDIRSITAGLRELLGSEEGKSNLKELVANLKDASASFKIMGEKITKGEGTLGKLIVDDELYQRANQLIARLDKIAADIEAGQGTLGKLLADEKLYDETTEAFANLKEAAQAIQDLAAKIESGQGTLGKLVSDDSLYNETHDLVKNLNQIAKDLRAGQGTLGKLLTDDSLYYEAKKTLRNVNKASANLQEQIPVTILGTLVGTAVR